MIFQAFNVHFMTFIAYIYLNLILCLPFYNKESKTTENYLLNIVRIKVIATKYACKIIGFTSQDFKMELIFPLLVFSLLL